MTAKPIAAYGVKRTGYYVTVTQDGARVIVRWREANGVRKSKEFGSTAEDKRHAKAWAKGTHDRLVEGGTASKRERLTLRDLWDRYVMAKGPSWRDKTARNEATRWAYFAGWATDTAMADSVTPEALDEFTAHLIKRGGVKRQGIAPNQVRAIVGNVTRVYRWATRRGLIAAGGRLLDYKVPLGKDAKALDVAEFPPEEMAAVLGRFHPRDSRRWRAWVVSTIAATQGARVNAILRLANVDCDTDERTITWVSAHDKLGRERVQPLTRDAVRAIRVARVWRRRMGYDGRWLVPAVRKTRRAADLPWAYAAFHRLLTEAEREAGVPHRPYRAAHGIRRMVGRNALEASGDLNLAAEWIGDTDLRTFKKSYLKERGAALQGIAGKLSAPTAAIQPSTTKDRK